MKTEELDERIKAELLRIEAKQRPVVEEANRISATIGVIEDHLRENMILSASGFLIADGMLFYGFPNGGERRRLCFRRNDVAKPLKECPIQTRLEIGIEGLLSFLATVVP